MVPRSQGILDWKGYSFVAGGSPGTLAMGGCRDMPHLTPIVGVGMFHPSLVWLKLSYLGTSAEGVSLKASTGSIQGFTLMSGILGAVGGELVGEPVG